MIKSTGFEFQKAELPQDFWLYRNSSQILTQSICTQYSCFENIGRFLTLQKKGPKYGLQKAGCKKTGSLLFKKRRSSLFFCILHFETHILDPYICLTFKSSYWVPFSGLKIHDLIKTSWIVPRVILCPRQFHRQKELQKSVFSLDCCYPIKPWLYCKKGP